jgi:hypothetical protein
MNVCNPSITDLRQELSYVLVGGSVIIPSKLNKVRHHEFPRVWYDIKILQVRSLIYFGLTFGRET